MKKFLILIVSVFCFSIVSNAQTGVDEEFDKMRKEMKTQMENMMKQFEQSFDMMEGGVMMMDTMMLSFGDMDENGNFQPNEKMESIIKDMELMMKDAFGDFNFEGFKPVIPGPDSMEENGNKTPKNNKQNGQLKEKEKKRSTTRL